jgi:hypothetical protein
VADFVGLPIDKLLNRRNPITRIELLENKNGARPSATNIQISQISQNTGNMIVDGSLQVVNPTTGLPDVVIDQYGITFANQEGSVNFEDTTGNLETLIFYSDADNFVVLKNAFGGKGISFLIDDASHVVNQVDITADGINIERGMEIYLESGAAPLSAGWFPHAETWTRTGNHTFTVPGDLTAVFRKGMKVKYSDGTFEYGVVASSSEAAGTTTVDLIPNADYAMSGNSTENYISPIENPEGFPTSFAASFGTTNITATSGTVVQRWTAQPGKFKFFYHLTFGASSAITGDPTLTLPVTMPAYGGVVPPVGLAEYVDGGATVYAGVTVVVSTTTVKAIAYNVAGTYAQIVNVSSTVPFTWTTTDSLQIEGEVIW